MTTIDTAYNVASAAGFAGTSHWKSAGWWFAIRTKECEVRFRAYESGLRVVAVYGCVSTAVAIEAAMMPIVSHEPRAHLIAAN